MIVKLKDILKKQGKTIYWLSQQTGITNQNLGLFANGKTKSIKFETIEKICKVLDCNIEDILQVEKD